MSFEQRSELYRAYMDSRTAWPPQWSSAAFSSEFLGTLTSGELAELRREMHELIKRHTDAARAAQDAGDTEGRENVALHVYGFPFRQ